MKSKLDWLGILALIGSAITIFLFNVAFISLLFFFL